VSDWFTADPLEGDAVHTVLAAATEVTALPFPPAVFGVGAFVGLVALMLVTYAFRNLGSRH
jgi:hypothetical protein